MFRVQLLAAPEQRKDGACSRIPHRHIKKAVQRIRTALTLSDLLDPQQGKQIQIWAHL